MTKKQPYSIRTRRAAVTVEMALLAPIFVTIIAGLATAARLLDSQSQLAMSARVGARLATMDRANLLTDGQNITDKITQEVRTYLTSNGLPGDAADIFIVDPTDHTTPFDLDDPDNDLELFELRVELPYSELSGLTSDTWSMSSKVVFRNARCEMVQ